MIVFLTAAFVFLTALPALAVAPTVTNVSPSAASNTGSVVLTITGSGFVTGTTTVVLDKKVDTPAQALPPQANINGTSVSVSTPTSMSATFNLTDAAPGLYTVRVTTPDGNGSCDCFTVTASVPTVAELNPDSRARGTNGNHTITGTNFAHGATTSFSGDGITVNSTTFVSNTQLTVNISVASNASLGARNVTVTNTDGQAGGCNGCFSVELAIGTPPTVLSAAPASRGQGATNQNITVSGLGFVNGAVVSFPPAAEITVNSTTFVDPTTLTANISVSPISPVTPGGSNITLTVTNPDDQFGDCDCFAVNAAPVFDEVTPVSPPAASNTGNAAVTLHGENFKDGAAVVLKKSSPVGGQGDIAANGEDASADGTSMSMSFDLTAAAPGLYSIHLVNGDGGVGDNCEGCFTVGAAQPTVTLVNPDAKPAGVTNQDLTVTGTNFAHGAAGSFSGSGITVVSTTFVSPTQLTVKVTIASDAATGTRNLTVTNTDGQSGTCTGCFSISTPAPVVTSASPAYAARGVSSKVIVLTGTGFNSGIDVDFTGTGVNATVSSVVRNSSTTLTITISVPGNATLGLRPITVTNTDTGTSTCITCFIVTAFGDVPPGAFAFDEITTIAEAGITSGCSVSPSLYCPNDSISRGQMAVFLLRAMGHAGHLPAYRGIFADVPASNPFARYIEHLYDHGVTAGCATGPRRYCPNDPVTRGEMAVFLLRAIGHAGHLPAYRGIFADVPSSHPFARYIEHLYDHGVTGGCATNPRRYCPGGLVTRAQMAVFIVRAFGL